MYYLPRVTQAHQGTTEEQGAQCAKAEGAVPVCSVLAAAPRGCQCPGTGKGVVSEVLVMAGLESSSLPTISPSPCTVLLIIPSKRGLPKQEML